MRAVVTGWRGQDGSLLCESLRAKGVEVLGIGRPGSPMSNGAAAFSLTDDTRIAEMIRSFAPDQIYHLAAAHHSSEQPVDIDFEREMVNTNFRAAEALLVGIARHRPSCRLLLAGTSQMFRALDGNVLRVDESTPMNPMSFYGRTKAWSREIAAHFRDRWGVFAMTAILFNHESIVRPERFVTRKITMAAARAHRGERVRLQLLDLEAQTDWSSAADVVEGMQLALAAREPRDYVFASGKARRVSELAESAFASVGLDWRDHVVASDVPAPKRGTLVGVTARAESELGWSRRVSFEDMIRQMVANDVAAFTHSATASVGQSAGSRES
jgi:GDPmannose 4,6-dehydratase